MHINHTRGGDIIKIRTVEELLKIGSGEQKYIDGKIYTFGKNNTYELENDFEFTGDFREVASRIKDNNILINGNDHTIIATTTNGTKEYYTEYSKYYIATNKYGYVLDGLELYYDGIDNTGTGEHSRTTTTWKDLSGNGRDGILTNFGTSIISGWGMNYLSFDGINDWVNCGEINNDNVTLDICYMLKSDYSKNRYLLGNWESGGAGIYREEGTLKGEFFSGSEWKTILTDREKGKNILTTATFKYDGKIAKNYIDGNSCNELRYEGKIGKPELNTVMAVGTNPRANDLPNGYYSDVDVYSCRIYNRGLSDEEILINNNADARKYKNNKTIPIYNEEQLLKVGTGEEVYIATENKSYRYLKGERYELKNNIETNNYNNVINKIKEGEIELKPTEYQIINGSNYYTSKSKYTIAVNKYGYIINGLELYLDGIDNTGNGHSGTTSTWKDLSGNNRNGELKNMTPSNSWTSNGLIFDGVDDYVPIAEMNYDNIAMEAVITKGEEPKGWQYILDNIHTGGYSLGVGSPSDSLRFNKEYFQVYIENSYKVPEVLTMFYGGTFEKEKRISLYGSYDGSRIISRRDNRYVYKDIVGTIKKPNNNTYMGLGGNMNGTTAKDGEYFGGTIHCIRIYSRALTDEEQTVNLLNDRERFEL